MAKKTGPFTPTHFRAWARRLVLDTGDPWKVEAFQLRFVADVFSGAPECWLVIPEGNAKTTLVGGIVLYAAEHREWSDIPVAASSRDQAEILYRAAAGFVERSGLSQFRCYDGYRRIICKANHSRIQVFAADDRTGDGVQPTLAVLEELHRHRSLNLYRTWRGKLQKRGGQLIAISTAGEPESEFEETRDKMREAADRVERKGAFTRAVGPRTVLHEYAVPDDKDPAWPTGSLQAVLAANPLKAVTKAVLAEKRSSPAMTQAHWFRFACGRAALLDSWIDARTWDALKIDVGDVAPGDTVFGRVVVGAGAAIALAAPRPGGKVVVKAWTVPAPEEGRISLKDLEFLIAQLHRDYHIRRMTFDAGQFLRSAEELRASSIHMEEVPQTPQRLEEATATLWRLMSAGLLGHDGDHELRKQVLAGKTKETEAGWRLVPDDSTRALIAVAYAAHEAAEVKQAFWAV